MISRLLAAALAVASVSFAFSPARSEPVVLEAQCLCKLGDGRNWYKAMVALTPESRDKMKTLIEAGSFSLWKTVTLKGQGCNPANFPAGFKEKCGDTSINTTDAKGKSTTTYVPNEEFSGEVTIEVKSNSGIPQAAEATPGKEVTVDEKRWPDTPSFSVMGVDVKAPKPAKKKR